MRHCALGEKHGFRNAQATVHCPDRHDRPGNGLRHHRDRAGFPPSSSSRSWPAAAAFQDHQPAGAAGTLRTLGYGAAEIAAIERYVLGEGTLAGAPGDQPREPPAAKGFDALRSPPLEAAPSPAPLRHQVRVQQMDAGRISARNGSASLTDGGRRSRYRPARRARLHPRRDRGRQHPVLRRNDPGGRPPPGSRSTWRCSIAPARAAGPCWQALRCRSRATSACWAATQPFISGAISKTINMPNTATVEDRARTPTCCPGASAWKATAPCTATAPNRRNPWPRACWATTTRPRTRRPNCSPSRRRSACRSRRRAHRRARR